MRLETLLVRLCNLFPKQHFQIEKDGEDKVKIFTFIDIYELKISIKDGSYLVEIIEELTRKVEWRGDASQDALLTYNINKALYDLFMFKHRYSEEETLKLVRRVNYQ